MIQFNSLGDGNCLYNTQSAHLVYAFQQGLLEPLFKNKDFVKNLNQLFLLINQSEKEIKITSAVTQDYTSESVKNAFAELIQKLSNDNVINWILIQQVMAKGLRALVVYAIENDPQIQSNAKNDLTTYINGILESSKETGDDNSDLCALQLEINNQLKHYELKSATTLTKIEEIRNVVKAEFSQKLIDWLAKAAEKKERITGNVKQEINKVIDEAIKASEAKSVLGLQTQVYHAVDGYLKDTIEKNATNEALVYSAHFEGMPEIKAAIANCVKDPTLKTIDEKKKALLKWFFEGEAKGLKAYLNNQGGIGTSGINAGEFEQKVLTQLFSHVIHLYNLRFVNEHNRRVVDGFKTAEDAKKSTEKKLVFGMEKLPGHWNALLPDNEQSKKIKSIYDAQLAERQRQKDANNLQQILKEYGSYPSHKRQTLPDITDEEYCGLHGITKELYLASDLKKEEKNPSPSVSAAHPVAATTKPTLKSNEQPNERDWFNYTTMSFALMALIGVLSYGVLWQLLLPSMSMLFANTVLVGKLHFLGVTISTLAGGIFGIVLTEKIHKHWEKPNIAPMAGAIIPIPTTVAQPNSLPQPAPGPAPVLNQFQNDKAQLQAQAPQKTVEEKPSATPLVRNA